ncbi:chromosome partitioning protein ParA [Photobacterium nomapromontoriensis]|uniref:chromosome partitioning protein ParA n=1 Tax=Photobacterium nomapromontoriensis TaxID=2910237 RepID=UPI003D0CB70C
MKIQLITTLLFCSLAQHAHAAAPTTEKATAPLPQTGYFIDSPVTGLYYKTSSNLQGFTDKGAFHYNPGDVVSFFLGTNEHSYLLTQLSGQEVITPTLSSSTPSRSINMTRLLLSLDNTPQDRAEIELVSKMLSDPAFQQQLRRLDLNVLDSIKDSLTFDLVSTQEAVDHLNQSQHYIEHHFTSDEVIYSPLNVKLRNIIIKKKNHLGRACVLDLRYIDRPVYNTPIGEISYKITPTHLIEYPSIGDYFNSCYLDRNKSITSVIKEPISNFDDWLSMAACSMTGCTRSDLNGFAVEDHDDEGDWKYRTMAISFDPTTQLFMEKVQGLGPKAGIQHANKNEMIWFTYPENKGRQIDYNGIWQQTTYQQTDILESCLQIKDHTIFQAPLNGDSCPTDLLAYNRNVTTEYADMWWVKNSTSYVQLAQMNVTVRWYPLGQPAHYTTWEYLPAGQHWDQGILYRYQQTITPNTNGSDDINTYAISEFKKVAGDQ